MLSGGAVGEAAVSDVVAFSVPGGRTVSWAARALSVFEALSGWARCSTVSEDARGVSVFSALSVRAGWLADPTAVLSDAGTCPEARGTIKRLNPSSHVARRMECRDMNGLAFRTRCDAAIQWQDSRSCCSPGNLQVPSLTPSWLVKTTRAALWPPPFNCSNELLGLLQVEAVRDVLDDVESGRVVLSKPGDRRNKSVAAGLVQAEVGEGSHSVVGDSGIPRRYHR